MQITRLLTGFVVPYNECHTRTAERRSCVSARNNNLFFFVLFWLQISKPTRSHSEPRPVYQSASKSSDKINMYFMRLMRCATIFPCHIIAYCLNVYKCGAPRQR